MCRSNLRPDFEVPYWPETGLLPKKQNKTNNNNKNKKPKQKQKT